MLLILLSYLVFLWDCKIVITGSKFVHKIEYNGLLWVSLDYWTILKYNSSDTPMKWMDSQKIPV